MRALSPAEARTLAAALIDAADAAEAAGADEIDITAALSTAAGAALDSLEQAIQRRDTGGQ